MNNITKEHFDTAYNNHLPSGWIKFAYKYFSKETEKKNKALSNSITIVLIVLFAIGFISTALELPQTMVKVSTCIYCIVLPIIVAYLFSATIANNIRVKKIMKELGVNEEEYNSLVMMYG